MILLKYIFIGILIYYLIKLLYRQFVPAPVRAMIHQMRTAAQQMKQQQAGAYAQSEQPNQKPTGSVTITKPTEKAKSTSSGTTPKDKGEFIDYEEVE